MDGLLLNGMGAAINYIVSIVTQINIAYGYMASRRYQHFLDENLNSYRMQEIIDLLSVYMEHTFKMGQDAAI